MQVGFIRLGGGLDARHWYDEAKRAGFVPVWTDGGIIILRRV